MKLRYIALLAALALCVTSFETFAQINAFPSYREDFESSNGGWTASGTNNTWTWGTPTTSPYNSVPSGSRCWKTNLSGNYNDNEQSYVTSPTFDFSCFGSDPTISFYLVYNTETSYDFLNMQVSTDNGSTWNTLGSMTSGGVNWYTRSGSRIGDCWSGLGPAGTQTWKVSSHVLTGTAGKSSVKVRFRFDSEGSVNYAGVAFDLVQIMSSDGSTSVPPPALLTPADGAVDQPLTITFSWKAAACGNTYDFQIATDSRFTTIVLNAPNLTVTSASVSGFAQYTTYYWRLRTIYNGVPGNWSTPFSFTTIPPPPPAPLLSAPADGSTAQPLAPTISCQSTLYAKSYRFQVSTNPSFTSLVADQTQPGTNMALTGLSNFTTYYWRVQASNVSGTSPWSATWSFRSIVGIPQLLSPVLGSQGLAIPVVTQWNPVTGATSYELQASSDLGFTNIVATSTSTGVTGLLNGLANNSQFFWRVRALAGVTEVGGWSNVWNFSTIIGVPPLVSPLDGTTDIQTQPITVSWAPVIGKAFYKVQVSPDILFKTIIFEKANIDSLRLTINGLNPNTLYYWRVQASNPNTGTGSWANPFTFRTIVGSVSGSAPLDAAKGVQLPATLQWTNAGNGVTYRVQVATDAKFVGLVINDEKIGVTDATYNTNAGLKNYTTYYWRIQPISLSGKYVPWSATQSFTTILAAPAPISPADGAVNQVINAKLTWKAPAGAVKYVVRIYEDNASQTLAFEDNNVIGNSVTATGLKPEAHYLWTAQAVDADNFGSEWSPLWKFTTTITAAVVPALDKPANNTNDATADTKLEWKSAEFAQTYDVQLSTASNFGTTIVNLTNVADVTLPVNGLAYGQRYFWRVRAVNAAGPSAWSETWTFVVAPLAPAAAILVSPPNGAEKQEYTVNLKWNDVAGAETYQVQVSEKNDFASTVTDKAGLPVTAYPASGLKEKTAYYWRVRAKNNAGDGAWSDIWSFTTKQAPSSANEELIAVGARLDETYPNPASGATIVGFTLGTPATASLTIVNNLGETVAVLGTGYFTGGSHSFTWNSATVPAGVYVVRLSIGNTSAVQLINVAR